MNLTLPSGLQSNSFGHFLNQGAESDVAARPAVYQFWRFFAQSREKVTLLSRLQSISFGASLNQSQEKVTLPSGLQNISFNMYFDAILEQVTLQSRLQSIGFG